MALGKQLIQALSSMYILQSQTGKVDIILIMCLTASAKTGLICTSDFMHGFENT